MAKLLSNATAKQLAALLKAGVPVITGGSGIKVERFGNHLVIGSEPSYYDEFQVDGEPPFSSGEYGEGPP